MQSATMNLDGIIGPTEQCTCSHCQIDHLIDGIMPATNAQSTKPTMKEEINASTFIPVVEQVNN